MYYYRYKAASDRRHEILPIASWSALIFFIFHSFRLPLLYSYLYRFPCFFALVRLAAWTRDRACAHPTDSLRAGQLLKLPFSYPAGSGLILPILAGLFFFVSASIRPPTR